MKNCVWCGRENTDEATRCVGCGTDLVPEPTDAEPSQPRDRPWIKGAFTYVAATVLAVLFYFLSFGPVTRFTATVSQTTATTSGLSFTYQRTVIYPRWVGVVYYPAFSLTESGPGSVLTDLYWRYLRWWEPPPTNN